MLTPKEITQEMRDFAIECGADGDPFYAEISPSANARVDECHWNVEKCITEQGGSAVCGWVIWIDPDMFLQSQFHALWKDNDGKIHDVTPDSDGEKTRLFFPASQLSYDGRSLPGKWKPLTRSPDVVKACKWFQEAAELYCKHSREVGTVPKEDRLRIKSMNRAAAKLIERARGGRGDVRSAKQSRRRSKNFVEKGRSVECDGRRIAKCVSDHVLG